MSSEAEELEKARKVLAEVGTMLKTGKEETHEQFAAQMLTAEMESTGVFVPGSVRVTVTDPKTALVEATLAGSVRIVEPSEIIGFDVGQCSERGPRAAQEDALAADPVAGIFAVADGLGGGGDGDVAAQAAVARVVEMAAGREDWSAERLCVEAAHAADTAVRQAQATCGGRCQTTLAMLVVRGEQAAVAWCGDSRVYRLRGGTLTQLTEDHRYGRHTLSKCLGARDTQDSEADFRTLDTRPGDVFALVTDGVGDTLASSEMQCILLTMAAKDNPLPTHWAAEEMVGMALEKGSRDNCTALVVRVGSAS